MAVDKRKPRGIKWINMCWGWSRRINLLDEGRSTWHRRKVTVTMDMSFANQALASEFLLRSKAN